MEKISCFVNSEIFLAFPRQQRLVVRGDGKEICQLDKTIVIVTLTDKAVSQVKCKS